ncbi:MAG: hypothetical protein EZS28_056501, partial [Streblomastix strix]
PKGLSKKFEWKATAQKMIKAIVQREKVNVLVVIGFKVPIKIEFILINVDADVFLGQIQRNLRTELCARGTKKMKIWTNQSKITRISLSPYSPDLNLMKSFWGQIATDAYKGKRNFQNDVAFRTEIARTISFFPRNDIDRP